MQLERNVLSMSPAATLVACTGSNLYSMSFILLGCSELGWGSFNIDSH